MKRIIVVIAFAFIAAFFAVYFFLPSFRTSSFFDANKTSFIVEGDLVDTEHAPIIENGEILLPISIVKEYIDSNVHWDSEVGKVIFTTLDKVITMKTDKLTAMINARPIDLNIPVKVIDEVPYIPILFLSDMLDVEVKWIEKNNVVILDKKTDYVQIAEVIEANAAFREQPTIKAAIIDSNPPLGSTMRVFEEYEKWYKVRTEEGLIGFIEKKYVKIIYKTNIQSTIERNNDASWQPDKGKISLAWEYVYSKSPSPDKLKSTAGLDVVSPTWFEIVDKEGTVSNKADMNYVNWAHQNGYKVWGMINNSYDIELTNIVLNNSDIREKIIQQILIYAELYKLDGINIDFENIYMKDKDMLTQFVRELTPLAKEQGLIVSIDVTVRSSSENWSKCYDRKALAEVVDFVALMAYDQHWATSPVAGSVAQLEWVERSINITLQEVPPQKLLLGLPFYTRLWKEEKINGKTVVSSKALSMSASKKIIKDRSLELAWDAESGQYYAEYLEENARYRIWLEDEASINLKSSLVHKYELAGTAAWRKGFETDEIWNVLAENLKEKQNYVQWAQANDMKHLIIE